jgi:hypothetical protein
MLCAKVALGGPLVRPTTHLGITMLLDPLLTDFPTSDPLLTDLT